MKIEPQLTHKKVAATVVGELILFGLRSHRAIGLIIASDDRSTLVAVVHTDEAEYANHVPFAVDLDRSLRSKDCLSYGTEWTLELIPGKETRPENRGIYAEPGVVYLCEEGATLYVPKLGDRLHDGYAYNFTTQSLTKIADSGVPFLILALLATVGRRTPTRRNSYRSTPLWLRLKPLT